MAFCTINGLTIPVFKDSFRESSVYAGDMVGRGINGALLETRSARKRQWTWQMTPQRSAVAEKYRKWLEGFGQGYSFNAIDTTNHQSYSRAGMGHAFGGSLASVAGKHSNAVTVGSNARFGFTHNNVVGVPGYAPTMGWTHLFWAYMTLASGEVGADGWYHCTLTGNVSHSSSGGANPASVTQYRNGVVSSNMGRKIDANTTAFALWGKRALVADTSAAINYDDWLVLPFQIESSWVSSIYTFASSYAMGMPPVTKLFGDCIPDTTPVEVVCRVDGIDYMGGTLSGASSFESNNKILNVTAYEV